MTYLMTFKFLQYFVTPLNQVIVPKYKLQTDRMVFNTKLFEKYIFA